MSEIKVVLLKPKSPYAHRELREIQKQAYSESLEAHNRYEEMCRKSSFRERDFQRKLFNMAKLINGRRCA